MMELWAHNIQYICIYTPQILKSMKKIYKKEQTTPYSVHIIDLGKVKKEDKIEG